MHADKKIRNAEVHYGRMVTEAPLVERVHCIGLIMLAARSIAASQIAPAPMLSDHIGELVQGDANGAIETRQRDANDARTRAIRLAAKQGQPEAEHTLARMYSAGVGVVRDDSVAAMWYQKAADQGYAPAQNRLGYAYLKGLGLQQDDALAVQWMMKSAKGGYAPAQYNVGVFYELAI
ncbi:tetratricopeptide repeat protein [Caballeronia sp. dw_276]|uniref:tetratricopeptide repeat protein n=1 Tax=Caballeronia sp. dw_276 TaxID=2719795 RepID=UPI001BD5EEC0|nr:tetratricopeptide repeat protein [Caballeronia sp. dw_276]